jgi:SOS-response transcriptional repressor LexA
MKKEVIKRMVRLAKGVAVAGRVVRVLPVDETGEKWQAVVLVAHDGGSAFPVQIRGQAMQVREIFEGDLRLVRKITCAYYPSACRHFGAARGYSAAQVGRQ